MDIQGWSCYSSQCITVDICIGKKILIYGRKTNTVDEVFFENNAPSPIAQSVSLQT